MFTDQNFSNLLAEPLPSLLSQESSILPFDYNPLTVVHESCQPDFEPSVLDSTYWANQIPDHYPYTYLRTGQGELSGPQCNSFLFTSACVDKGPEHRNISARRHYKHCKRLSCPVCYHSAVERTARRIVERHSQLDHQLRVQNRKKHLPSPGEDKHQSISFDVDLYPPEFFLKDGGKEALRKVNEILARYSKDGFYGGELILHLERKKHADDLTECRKKKCRRKHTWVFGGHVHYTGKGFIDSDKVYQDYLYAPGKSAILVHRIEDRGGGRDLYATVRYELTHAAQFISKASGRAAKNYRYVGALGDRVAVVESKRTLHQELRCGVHGCKAPRHKFAPALTCDLQLVPDDRFEVDQGVLLVSRVVRKWRLKDRIIQLSLERG